MSGITPAATFWQSFYPYMSGTQYPLQIDSNSAVMQRLGAPFAPSPLPDGGGMYVVIDPGHIINGSGLAEVGAWSTGTITSGSNQLVLTEPVTGFENGFLIVGAATVPGGSGLIGNSCGIPDGTVVSSSSGLTITMSENATLSGTVYVKICQIAGLITAPASGHTRTDRVCINPSTGLITYVEGTPVTSGVASPPAIPPGYWPCCQIFLSSTITAIGSTEIMDERDFSPVYGQPSGGFINGFRNGNFDVAQRGPSGATTSSAGVYTLDGWIAGSDGTHTLSWSQSGGQPGGSGLYRNNLLLTGASGTTDTFIKQRIESSIAAKLAGQQVTVQFTIFNNLSSGSLTPTLTVKHPTAADNWGSTVTDVSAVSLQTIANGSAEVVSYTFTAAANTFYGLEITLDFGNALNSGSNSISIGLADIRSTPGLSSGLNNNPPVPEVRPVPAELAICQRYFCAFSFSSGGIFISMAQAINGTQAYAVIPLPVTMRANPTAISASTATDFALTSASASNITGSSLTFATGSPSSIAILVAVASGLVAGNASIFESAAAASIQVSGAEL